MVNPADAAALEMAYKLKKENGNEGFISAITMGPKPAEDVLKHAAHQGADRLILLSDSVYAGSDTYATARIISKAILETGGFDLVLCGRKSIDGETGQVGPQLSVQLGVPCLTNVMDVKLSFPGVICKCLTEKGIDEIYVPMPAVITFCENMLEHKPTLFELKKAKEIKIERISNDRLNLDEYESGLKGSKTRVRKIIYPEYKGRNCRMINNIEEAADIVINKIRENRRNE
jgi:electron transfer flavoprotein beta subunit